MDESLKRVVRERAVFSCEYCQLPQDRTSLVHQFDHIIAVKHRGATITSNLAWACYHCNHHKGPCIAGIDPVSGAITRLFHPRLHKWFTHFQWNDATLVGRTAIGRTTIEVLEINLPHRVVIRQMLIDEGVFPPKS